MAPAWSLIRRGRDEQRVIIKARQVMNAPSSRWFPNEEAPAQECAGARGR